MEAQTVFDDLEEAEYSLSDAQTVSDDQEHVRESFSKGRIVETGWHFQ
jgi:hypothetical protein